MGKKNPEENLQKNRNNEKQKKRIKAACITAVCIVAAGIGLAAAILVYRIKHPDYTEYVIAQAEYPKTISYPEDSGSMSDAELEKKQAQREEYFAQSRSRLALSEGYRDALFPFYEKTMQEFLAGGKQENRVYSPLNLYMALSMLSELTDGNSRAQLLALLNAEDIDAVRKSASALWNANYASDNLVTSRLANSVWLSSEISYEKETVKRLADTYYASVFKGDMESEEFSKVLVEWLNEQTSGLLKDAAGNVKLRPDAVLALVSTIEFRAQWVNKWNKANTQEGIFHTAAGDRTCDFMHEKNAQTYYWGERFSAVFRSLTYSGGMWFFLPDETVSADEVLADGEFLRLLQEGGDWENQTYIKVNLAVPKFDIAAELDLTEGLKELGVTDVFDWTVSDFTPVTSETEIYVSEAKHAARVLIDEEGCAAAAFTSLQMSGASMPPEEEVDFILDRPFLFAITGEDGSILFLGIVENP